MLYGLLPEVEIDGVKMRGVRAPVANPPKLAILGLPTNAQMVERLNGQKHIRRSLGRRKSQTEYVPNTAADLDLFNKIRVDKGPEFDEFEAGNALSKLTACEVTECERQGDQYRITIKTLFGSTVHTLNIPFQKDIQQYRRSVVGGTDLPHGMEELRYRIEPPMKLYDLCIDKIEGYMETTKPTDVPPHHKSIAIAELIQTIDDLDPEIDPNS